ncbi:protein PTST, chloroplastic isoform X2 [Manihot esculenta]|uniref:Uncharacterized protein n=1 Tax=Manihot esculenta TaxID=3983 RepID=A0ACB7I4I2_MANES|nr:protein PTST, chloroplastic isoform X2 [Manihot esculenta]XP_021605026.1 protein PTST, chloroplastic isoform X2 [Manihot esculenta]KAG8659772.1 hypothetical protein MANES_02G075700v8 [Manihot esculenta]
MKIGTTIKVPWFSWSLQMLDWKSIQKLHYNVIACNVKMSHPRLSYLHPGSATKKWMSREFWRTSTMPIDLGDSSSIQTEDEENGSTGSSEDLLAQPLSSDDLKALLADSEREKLMKKLSEANQHNRFLKRQDILHYDTCLKTDDILFLFASPQLHVKEDELVNWKNELAVMELEIQALVKLAEEIAQSDIPEGSRKINGKYIQSHLLSRLEAVHERLEEQIKDIDAVQSKEVHLFWCGMAESVQVMGSFDGWSLGEHLSPEYDGSFTKFTTTLMLRPGRYEIKFLVDGEWQLSPEYPTVGEGLTENNLLVVG